MSPCYIEAICPTSDGAWTSNCFSKTLTQINKEGQILQKIKYKVCISDVSVSPITNNGWTCSREDYSIMECPPTGTPVVRFSTDVPPYGLCCTQDGCILVGMSKKITKFNTKGKVVTSEVPWFGRPLVCTPHRITECSVTRNIAVVDRDSPSDGGEDKACVVVMDNNFHALCQYMGNVPNSQQQTTKIRSGLFDPYDVIYDTVGNIVIADWNNGCLHLLSGSGPGEYMKLFDRNSDFVRCIGIDKDTVLWAGFVDDTIKLLQYNVVMVKSE